MRYTPGRFDTPPTKLLASNAIDFIIKRVNSRPFSAGEKLHGQGRSSRDPSGATPRMGQARLARAQELSRARRRAPRRCADRCRHRARHQALDRHDLLQAGEDGDRDHGAGAALRHHRREDQSGYRRGQVHGARVARPFRAPGADIRYFAACVAIWSTTWLAITYQLGTVAPEMSVAYRFLLASLLLFAWCLIRGLPLRFSAREHAWLALFGLGSFGVS